MSSGNAIVHKNGAWILDMTPTELGDFDVQVNFRTFCMIAASSLTTAPICDAGTCA